MATSQGDDSILIVQGGVPESLKQAGDEIIALYRRLSAKVAELETEQANLQGRLQREQTDAVRRGLEQREADVRASIARMKAELESLNQSALRFQQSAAQPPAVPPPPPQPPQAQPSPQSPAGGGAGGLAALGFSSQGLTAAAAQFLGLYATIRLIREAVSDVLGTLEKWAEQGVAVNEQLELMRVGLQASISQNFSVVDAQGRQLSGLEAINALQETSLALQAKIIGAAVKTGTTIESFATAYRLVVPLSKDFGLSLDQSLSITQALVVAGRALGLSLDQVKFQISQILSGHVNVRTVLARELFGGDATSLLAQAKAQGNLIDLVVEKTRQYSSAQGELANTFAFVANAAKVAGEVALKEATSGGFEVLRVALKTLVDYAFELDKKTGEFKIRPEFQQQLDAAKAAFREFVLAAVDLAPILVQTFVFIAESVGNLVTSFALVVGGIDRVRAQLAQAEGERKDADRKQIQEVLNSDTAAVVLSPEEKQRLRQQYEQLGKEGADAYHRAWQLEDSANQIARAFDANIAAGKAADEAVKNIESLGARVRKAIDDEQSKAKPPAQQVTTTPLPPEQKRADVIAAIKLDADRQTLEIRRQEFSLLEDTARLEAERATMSASDYERAKQVLAVRKGELELAAANVKVVEAARVSAVSGPGDKQVGLQAAEALVRAQTAAAEAQAKLNAAMENTSRLTKAEEYELEREASLRLAALRLTETEHLAVAEEDVLAVERQALEVHRATRDTELVRRQESESRVAIAQAELAVIKARLKLEQDEAALAKAQAVANSPTANAQQRGEAQVESLRIQAQIEQDRVALDGALLRVAQTTTQEYDRQTQALRDQIAAAGDLKRIFEAIDDLGNVFGGLNRDLQQFIQSVSGVNKLFGDFVAQVRKFSADDSGVSTPLEGLKKIFGSFSDFVESLKSGALLQIGGAIVGGITTGIQTALQPGTLKKVLGGAEIGLTLGSAIGGPIGAALGASIGAAVGTVFSTKNIFAGAATGFLLGGPIGGILGGFFASERKETDRIFKQIQKQIAATIKQINDGTGTIGQELKDLEKERADAVSRLSGKKGGEKDLKQITDQIDPIIAQLKQQQKAIIDAFNTKLTVLEAPEALRDTAQSLSDLQTSVKQFIDAGGDALQAQKFLALGLKQIYEDVNTSLTDSEKSQIDLMQQSLDLAVQRADVIKQANDKENQIRQSLGIVRVVTPAQNAAQQIRDVELQKQQDLEKLDRQKALLDAQTQGAAELFGLTQDQVSLDQVRLALAKAQTQELVQQILLQKQFLASNSAQFNAALAAAKAATGVNLSLPSITGGVLKQGGPTYNLGPINVTLAPTKGMTPTEQFEQFVQAVRAGVGNRGISLLNSIR